MRKKILFVIFFFLFLGQCVAGDKTAILAMIERILPGRSNQFQIVYITAKDGKDCYHIEYRNLKIILSGNNNISIAVALNEYLHKYCHASTSWTGDQLALPKALPVVPKMKNGQSPYPYRFYLNYCTFSYSMAFWDWKRWEKEIDWMAMHGINLPLAIVGQEAVWQNTLRKYGYKDAEIKSFICGPSFNAWWLMGNLEGWGGPVPQSWIEGQASLQKKILNRMRSLGMQPVLQGFYGMVPNSLAAKFPKASIHDPGTWLGFKRPAMLLPTDPLFAKIAKTYYQEQAKLYGSVNYFQGDPFHEGGNAEGVDLKAAGVAIYRSMNEQQPGAVWVLQSWQNNPRAEMLSGIPNRKALVTNIMAEAKPQWGGKTKYWEERKDGFSGHDFIWSEIPNFGGRTGMTAKLDSTAIDIFEALHHPIGQQSMKGIGAAPESIGQDAIIYDLIYDLGWTTEKIDPDSWLKDYVQSRYGKYDETILQAWQILRRTVYNAKYGKKDPPIESILCARPGWNKTSASTWGSGKLDYDSAELIKAWKLLKSVAEQYNKIDTYRYDLVNLTRQVLANYARTLYQKMHKAYESKNIQAFTNASGDFLSLIKDQDRLLNTRKEFLLGEWLEMAKQKGHTTQEKQLYEWNARTLITTWTHELNDVNDYSCREWGGLMKDYYLPRWEKFIQFQLSLLQGETAVAPDYFQFEKQWALQQNVYPTIQKEKELAVIAELFEKYKNIYEADSLLIPFNQTAIAYQGRIGMNQKGFAELFWAGSSMKISFEGTGILSELKDEKGDNYYEVILDGVAVRKIRLDAMRKKYLLADHLSKGRHTVELFKCTQWDKGKTFFYGFSLSPDSKVYTITAASKRKIEFYGNSITCGSAVEDSNGYNSGESRYENNWFSYAAMTARHYDAAYTCIARSGIGLMVSWYPLTMPEMYNRLDPSDPKSRWDFSKFLPHIVVVNLLQNDSWIVNLPKNEQFKVKFGSIKPPEDFIIEYYQKFITSIRDKYPLAKIICVLGNMDATATGSPWPEYIKKSVQLLSDKNIYSHFFAYKGTQGHPTIQEQKAMSVSLIRFIDQYVRW
jgi:alpha-N-acetylglucosaminidase